MNKILRYRPLIVIVLVASMAAASRQLAVAGPWSWMLFMPEFMGLFFIILAMFKFFDLRGFVEGFLMYDLVAQRFRPYAYAYPFIELLLGLGYLSGLAPLLINSLTLLVMSVSAAGVMFSLSRGLDVKCACLGTTLKVPLSTVSVVENVGMGLMAFIALLTFLS